MEDLSDEEIRAALALYKCNIPVTENTRPVLLRLIAQGRAAPDIAGREDDLIVADDAIFKLSKIPVDRAKIDTKTSQIEKANEFPGLKVPQFNRFRELIEGGEVEEFARTVWENPRYLITQGDAPEVLKLGPRYNALHCAVKAGSLGICKKLFEILEGDRYWSLVYPGDPVEVRNKRRDHLIDLYLNTCDKGLQETPLHFACKHGYEDIVSYLLKFPVDTAAVNKHGEKPYQVAEKNSSEHSKRRIQALLSAPEIYYVPVVRAVDNTIHPRLAAPCTRQDLEYQQQRPIADKRDTPVINSAVAGPMSPLKAKSFYKEWRCSPSESERKVAKSVMRSDPDRGLERIGRRLAHQQRVGWKEYWGFLDRVCDLSNHEGLEALENYLDTNEEIGGCVDIAESMASLSLSVTPKRSQRKFLTGSLPTKLDYDVLVAIDHDGDMSNYPNVKKWHALVISYSEEEQKRWPTPKRLSRISRNTLQAEQYSSPLVYSHSTQQSSNHTPQMEQYPSPLAYSHSSHPSQQHSAHSTPLGGSIPTRLLFQDPSSDSLSK